MTCSPIPLGLLSLVLLAPGLALAADPPTRAPAVQSVIDCRKISDSAGRLACYDHAVDEMAKAQTSGDLVTIDRQQRATLRSQAFGFNLPALGFLGHDKSAAEDDRITAKVASASRDRDGRWVIRLEDGAVWGQTDDAALFPDPKPGSTVVIRKGMLGSYFMAIDGKAGVRAARRS